MKPSRLTLPLAILILIVVSIVSTIVYSVFRTTDKDYATTIYDVQKEYTMLHSKGQETWFVTDAPQPEFYEKAADVALSYGDTIKSHMSKYKAVNQTTTEIWTEFSDFITSVQLNPTSPLATIANPRNQQLPPKGHEVSLLPRTFAIQFAKSNLMGLLLAWRVEDHCISLAATDWPEKFLVGALYHEFYHAKMALASPNNRFRHLNEKLMALEEMRASELEVEIINTVTGGAYYQLFDEIESRTGSASDTKHIVSLMTLDDMKRLDKMLGIEQSGLTVAMFSCSQYTLGLATHSMSKRSATDAERTEFYLWLKSSDVVQ